MISKNFWLRIADTIFGIVSLLHLLRIVMGIQVLIGEWPMPVWFNWMGLFGAYFLCSSLLLLSNSTGE